MDVPFADLYSCCKAERRGWSPLTIAKRAAARDGMTIWAGGGYDYYMLLCRERNDHTIFHKIQDEDMKTFAQEVSEVIESRGEWIAADYNADTDAWELWVKDSTDVYMYLLFDCDSFIVDCR